MQIEIRGTKYTPATFTDRDIVRIISLASSGINVSLSVEQAAAAALRKVFPDASALTDGDNVNLHTFELLPIAAQLGNLLAEDPNFKGSLPALKGMLSNFGVEGSDDAIDQLEAGFNKLSVVGGSNGFNKKLVNASQPASNKPRRRHR